MCYNNTARKYGKKRRRGDMAQLVERRVRNAKARGSNPLISTKISYILCDIFLCGKGDSHDFIVVLLCNMNPYGLTLTLLRKRPGRFLRIPLSPPHFTNPHRWRIGFLFSWNFFLRISMILLFCGKR